MTSSQDQRGQRRRLKVGVTRPRCSLNGPARLPSGIALRVADYEDASALCAKLCAWGSDEWREGPESICEILFLGAEFRPRYFIVDAQEQCHD
jgi:hypothetical protein